MRCQCFAASHDAVTNFFLYNQGGRRHFKRRESVVALHIGWLCGRHGGFVSVDSATSPDRLRHGLALPRPVHGFVWLRRLLHPRQIPQATEQCRAAGNVSHRNGVCEGL